MSVLPASWSLPESLVNRLGSGPGRQRAMADGGHLLLVLHAPPAPDNPERSGRLFWRAPDGTWRSTSHGGGAQAIDAHLAEFAYLIDAFDDRLDTSQRADEFFAILQHATPLQRTARNLHVALQQARELMPKARDVLNFRDRAGEIERAAELLYKDSQQQLEFLAARKSEELSDRLYQMTVSSHRLNLLAALFFPLATLAALFGMNLEHGLEGPGHPGAFWIVLLVGILGGAVLMAAIAARPKVPSATPQRGAPQRLPRMPREKSPERPGPSAIYEASQPR